MFIRKLGYKYIIFVIATAAIILSLYDYSHSDYEMYIISWNMTEDISCHYVSEDDALPQLGSEYSPPEESIFFHETSCRGGLNSRQACAVESAARAHPNWQIHMLFSGPVSSLVLKRSCLATLLKYENVKLLRIHLKDYAKDTPVESLVDANVVNKSKWRIEHTSDVLRYLTLYKFGGVYVDSDVVVVKSFDSLENNWAARESNKNIVSGLMAFSRDKIGRRMAEAAAQDIKKNFKPNMWDNNGPGVITRVVKQMCSQGKDKKKWLQGCDGFKVYEPVVFYPVYYTKNRQYFEQNRNLSTSDKTYAHHIWNALTKKYEVPRNSPYAKLAKEYCPKVYEIYGDKFGV